MKIIIADDHAMTRTGVMASLAKIFPTADIIECIDASSVLAAAKSETLSLAIVDLFMPGDDSFGFLKKLCNTYPGLPVVVLSASDNPKHVRKAIDLGVSGFIHKSASFEFMREAINTVLDGGIYQSNLAPENGIRAEYLSSNFDEAHKREIIVDRLTKRQLEILSCLAKAMSNKDIAKSLFISENTVKTHLKALMLELGCNNRTEAGVMAEKLGLIDSP